jgi:tetratricopeptide repeat protein 7
MMFLVDAETKFLFSCRCVYLCQEARALLGRLEFQKGNVEAALRVFDGIDLQAAIQQLQPSLSDKTQPKKARTKSELPSSVPQQNSQNPAYLVLEAIYLKSLSLQKLGRSKGTTP